MHTGKYARAFKKHNLKVTRLAGYTLVPTGSKAMGSLRQIGTHTHTHTHDSCTHAGNEGSLTSMLIEPYHSTTDRTQVCIYIFICIDRTQALNEGYAELNY